MKKQFLTITIAIFAILFTACGNKTKEETSAQVSISTTDTVAADTAAVAAIAEPEVDPIEETFKKCQARKTIRYVKKLPEVARMLKKDELGNIASCGGEENIKYGMCDDGNVYYVYEECDGYCFYVYYDTITKKMYYQSVNPTKYEIYPIEKEWLEKRCCLDGEPIPERIMTIMKKDEPNVGIYPKEDPCL